MLSTKMYHLKGSNYVDSCEIAESPAIGDLIPRRFDPRIPYTAIGLLSMFLRLAGLRENKKEIEAVKSKKK